MTILQQRNQNPMAMGVAGPCFNGIVGPHRQSSFASVSLEDVRAVKDALGVKVNDVVLGLVSGALRSHMERHGDMPASGPLAAQVPVSTRLADDNDHTNKVATMSATLATDIDDPIERMQAIHASTQSAKELTEAIRARKIQSVGEVAPPLLLNLASRAAWATNITDRVPRVANVVVSNVPGPPFPIYSCGAQVSGIYAASVLLAFAGLNITLFSYIDRVDFGLTSDPDLLEDPWEIADGTEGRTRRADGCPRPRQADTGARSVRPLTCQIPQSITTSTEPSAHRPVDPRPHSRLTPSVRRDVLVDAAAYRLVTSRASRPDPALLQRIDGEVSAALALFDGRGLAASAGDLPPDPPAPSDVRSSPRPVGQPAVHEPVLARRVCAAARGARSRAVPRLPGRTALPARRCSSTARKIGRG